MATDDDTITKRITQLIAIWSQGNDYEQHLAWQLGRVFDVTLLELDLNSYENLRIGRIIAAVESMGKCEYGCSTEAIRLIKETK